MVPVNLVDKKHLKMELFDIVKFQIISYCFFEKLSLNDTELNCLTLLGIMGKTRLIDFCRKAAEEGYLGNATAVNNCMRGIEKGKFFMKEKNAGKKLIFLNPEMQVQSQGNILIKYMLLRQSESN